MAPCVPVHLTCKRAILFQDLSLIGFGNFRHRSFPIFPIPQPACPGRLEHRMLCGDCEQLLSTWEKKFSEECFVPLNSGHVRNVTYGPWMLKFAASVSWRVLQVFVASGYCSGFPTHIVNQINDTLQEWADLLMGNKPHPGRHEQHMFVVDVIESTSIPNIPRNISRYLSRPIDVYVGHDRNRAMSYAKMGRFVLFGFITMKNPRHWKGTKLHVQHGRFGQQDMSCRRLLETSSSNVPD